MADKTMFLIKVKVHLSSSSGLLSSHLFPKCSITWHFVVHWTACSSRVRGTMNSTRRFQRVLFPVSYPWIVWKVGPTVILEKKLNLELKTWNLVTLVRWKSFAPSPRVYSEWGCDLDAALAPPSAYSAEHSLSAHPAYSNVLIITLQ